MESNGDDSPLTVAVIERVATARSIDADRLATLVADHQERMATLPGVENLLYEWRKQFDATVLARTEAAYYVDAPEWVWPEFGESIDATDAELTALQAVHQAATVAAVEPAGLEDVTPIVLERRD